MAFNAAARLGVVSTRDETSASSAAVDDMILCHAHVGTVVDTIEPLMLITVPCQPCTIARPRRLHGQF
jgi:hypothetical protein